MMDNTNYKYLVLFRAVTVVINLFVIGQLNIPFDFIALVIGLWVTKPSVRAAIFALEVLNLMLAGLGLFFGNYLGSFFGLAISGFCLYMMCRPDIKERFG